MKEKKGIQKSTRERKVINDIHERKRKEIHNPHERDKESTIYTREKEKGSTIHTRETRNLQYTREIVKEKNKSVQKGIQEHSKRGFFKSTVQP